ncbi:Phosphatidate phosphatase APP1 [Pleurostoma richardsiae]|uniref:Phosphatidate phosphatase APP1 n=1 Tax=Pleurostoma richardsiae TaxID=41990 RepID=A0AA38RNI5_9PEZI|nr:Phosphatidate phosphatase APP1 [Pleurostoma richardsiae]
MQLRTRREHGFAQAESRLPGVGSQTAYKLLKKTSASAAVQNVLSYLGPRNPLPQPVRKDDAVWLLDNTAFQAPGAPPGRWEAEFVACVFQQHPSCDLVEVVKQVADVIGLADDDKAKEAIEQRIMPFIMDIRPGKQVVASVGGAPPLRLGPGGRNGVSSDIRTAPNAQGGTAVATRALVPAGVTGLLETKTLYADPEGWGVISDIDDTIKITQTSDPIGILRSTFIDEPAPVAGMPELYKFMHAKLTSAAPFFYLSASPYNLYPFLREFRDQHYPHGTLVLRDASWMSIPGLLSNLTLGTEEYKVDRMRKIHDWLPRRKMICIGDSTQSDPEAYGDIYRAYPGWIRVILIRKVTDIAAVGIETKNEPERFEKAFKDIPQSAWHVFEDPAECYQIVQDALSS